MKDVSLDYGDGSMLVELPDSSVIVRYGETYADPPEVDPYEKTRKALNNPLGFPPLRELGGPNKKVVIGFPDRVKGGVHSNCHRKVAIPLIVEELLKGDTPLENISLLCCMGLHRKNTLEEWYGYLGKEIVDQFWPDRIFNHDVEAPDLCDFGSDGMGNVVQCNRMMAEADVPIVIGHVTGNPYGGYSGGYKMVVTGLSGWQSIATFHRPPGNPFLLSALKFHLERFPFIVNSNLIGNSQAEKKILSNSSHQNSRSCPMYPVVTKTVAGTS